MNVQLEETQGVRLAIEGCGHGTLHTIYASIAEACKRKGWPGIDLLIVGGDFQAVRNAYDLNCVSMPAIYREMCDFHEYYSGQRTAPYLTIFVGGNHEASNYLFELFYGGWVAPNIYYMGAANVLRFGPLRIAALSGIWKGYNYRKPHYERLPYNESDMKSIYHVREMDVRKLLHIKTQVDIGISHDWPKGVEWKGNFKQLFRFKQHFESDAKDGKLGSVAAKDVMNWLRPKWWFSAHLHCKYAAVVDHDKKDASLQAPLSANGQTGPSTNADEIKLEDEDDVNTEVHITSAKNADEIDLGDEDEADATEGPIGSVKNANEIELDGDAESGPPNDVADSIADGADINLPKLSLEDARAALPAAFRRPAMPEPVEHPQHITNKTTKFLALDKCLPGRHFLQLLTIPSETNVDIIRPLKLEYDREWLAITRASALHEPLLLGIPEIGVPKAATQFEYEKRIDTANNWVDENVFDSALAVPENFERVAPVYDGGNWNLPQYSQVEEFPNPQTAHFCKMLQIPNSFEISEESRRERMANGPRPDPEADRFGGERGRGGFGRGRGRGRGRGGPRGGNRGGGRGRSRER